MCTSDVANIDVDGGGGGRGGGMRRGEDETLLDCKGESAKESVIEVVRDSEVDMLLYNGGPPKNISVSKLITKKKKK